MYSDSDCKLKNRKATYALQKKTCRVTLRGSATQQCAFAVSIKDVDLELRTSNVEDVAAWMMAFEQAIAAADNDDEGRAAIS